MTEATKIPIQKSNLTLNKRYSGSCQGPVKGSLLFFPSIRAIHNAVRPQEGSRERPISMVLVDNIRSKMAANTNIKRMSVDELKRFLKDCGIPCSGKKREELVFLAERGSEKYEVLETCDHDESERKRKRVVCHDDGFGNF